MIPGEYMRELAKGLAACNSQTTSPFDCLNNFCFQFLSNFLGSLQFSDYLFKSPQMLERLVISSISGILRFGRYPAYHGISEPHLALKSSKTVVETAAYYYAASLSIAAFAEA